SSGIWGGMSSGWPPGSRISARPTGAPGSEGGMPDTVRRPSGGRADDRDEVVGGDTLEPADERAALVEDAVAVRERRHVVGDDRADDVTVRVEDEDARGVADAVRVADGAARGRRQLDPREGALTRQAGRGEPHRLPVGHADKAEMREQLDDPRASRGDGSRGI